MRLSAPKQIIWWIAVLAGLLGLAMHMGWVVIPVLSKYTFWLEAGGLGLLATATAFKGV